MDYIFQQGYLDSLCGVYSVVNADKIINKTSYNKSQRLFNSIVRYLFEINELDSIIKGIIYTRLIDILNRFLGKRLTIIALHRKFKTLDSWWQYSKDFLDTNKNSAIIITIGGVYDHYTVVTSMTDKTMTLADSGMIKRILKSVCELKGYKDKDKYIIYPYQCVYLLRGE